MASLDVDGAKTVELESGMEDGMDRERKRERENSVVMEKEINVNGERERRDVLAKTGLSRQGPRRVQRNTHQQGIALLFSSGLKFFFLFL